MYVLMDLQTGLRVFLHTQNGLVQVPKWLLKDINQTKQFDAFKSI